jgi:hypothetical protein
MTPKIEAGNQYWIELEGIRIKVRVIGPCSFLAGWWNCTSGRSGAELIVPESCIKSCFDGEAGKSS